MTLPQIAALYVAKGGAYTDLPGVDPWTEERDARTYPGPWPVVAHPPCSRWCRLAGLVEARWGHKKGDDGGTFKAALDAVHRWGGVLEHPAYSDAWQAFGLIVPPNSGGWVRSVLGGAGAARSSKGATGIQHARRHGSTATGPTYRGWSGDGFATRFLRPSAVSPADGARGAPTRPSSATAPTTPTPPTRDRGSARSKRAPPRPPSATSSSRSHAARTCIGRR